MRYETALTIWNTSIDQSPAEFLRECTIAELAAGFDKIAADYIAATRDAYIDLGYTVAAIAELRTVVAWVLDRESVIGQVAADDDDDDAEEFYNPFDDVH